MFRLVVVVLVALAGCASAFLDAGTDPTKLIVHYNVLPDPLGMELGGWYSLPRTIKDAEKKKYTQVQERSEDKTTVWCPKKDHRVCLLFDQQGSVAGIQISVELTETWGDYHKKTHPIPYRSTPEWRYQDEFMSKPVFTATTFFVDKETLLNGGRKLDSKTHTAPNGLYILQTNNKSEETGRLHVSTAEAAATGAGFTEQACFLGMGKHYFMGLSKTSRCEDHRPYFLLFGPKTKQLQGFGYTWYGQISENRGWFENPPALVAKKIAPNSPDCMTQWIKEYGMFTMHVFFVDKPFYTKCC